MLNSRFQVFTLRFKLQIKKFLQKKKPLIFQKVNHEKLSQAVKQKEILN